MQGRNLLLLGALLIVGGLALMLLSMGSGGSSAGRSAVGKRGVRLWKASNLRGSSARRGGRSLAMSTAIHGRGIDAAMIASEIRPLCHKPYATAASNSAGIRKDMMVRYFRTRCRC